MLNLSELVLLSIHIFIKLLKSFIAIDCTAHTSMWCLWFLEMSFWNKKKSLENPLNQHKPQSFNSWFGRHHWHSLQTLAVGFGDLWSLTRMYHCFNDQFFIFLCNIFDDLINGAQILWTDQSFSWKNLLDCFLVMMKIQWNSQYLKEMEVL